MSVLSSDVNERLEERPKLRTLKNIFKEYDNKIEKINENLKNQMEVLDSTQSAQDKEIALLDKTLKEKEEELRTTMKKSDA